MKYDLFAAALVAATATAMDVIDGIGGDDLCNSCHAAMSVINPALTGDIMTQAGQLFFKL